MRNSPRGALAYRGQQRSNYDRLATIKTTFDPEDLFHRNRNIKPLAPKFSTFHAANS